MEAPYDLNPKRPTRGLAALRFIYKTGSRKTETQLAGRKDPNRLGQIYIVVLQVTLLEAGVCHKGDVLKVKKLSMGTSWGEYVLDFLFYIRTNLVK